MTASQVAARSASLASLAGGVGAVLLPKCPVCFVAYGSALAALGVGPVAGQRVVDVAVVGAVAASSAVVLALAIRRRDLLTPLASATGAALVLAGRLVLDRPLVTLTGAAVLVAAALVNAVRCRRAAAG